MSDDAGPEEEPAERLGSVTVVGTAHVSAESAERVREEITDRRPDVVAVELDEGRYRQMQGETPDDIEASDLLSGNTVFQFLAYWMLSYVQSRLGERFDVTPGADMQAGIDTASELGIDVALVDRDIQTTIQRFWKRMTVVEKLKLVGGLALGITDPRTIGLSLGMVGGILFGLVLGLWIGPALGYGGLFALGLTNATILGSIGGAILGALAGLLLVAFVTPDVTLPGVGTVGIGERAIVGSLLGGAVGVALAATGTAVPFLVGTGTYETVGLQAVRAGTGIVAGAALGAGVGAVLGLLIDVLTADATAELDEEFDIESLTDGDVVTAMMEEFRRFSPGGAEALIDERDAFIAYKLLALRDAGHDVLAVVGAGHRQGIERYLEHPEELPPFESITGTESGRRFSPFKLIGYLVMAGFVSFFVLLALGGAQNRFLLELFLAWFLFNGIFAFAAARLAGARLSSASVGGAVAWLTSINPLLAPGWFTGYVELRHQPVNVADISTLNDLLNDTERPLGQLVDEMFDVPLFRLMVIVAMTNVGSIVATYSFPFVVGAFFFEGVDGVNEVGGLLIEGARSGFELLRGVFL